MRLRVISWAPMLLAIGLVSACQNKNPAEPMSGGSGNAAAPAQSDTSALPPGSPAPTSQDQTSGSPQPANPPPSQQPEPPKQ